MFLGDVENLCFSDADFGLQKSKKSRLGAPKGSKVTSALGRVVDLVILGPQGAPIIKDLSI